jgi:tetratricopeptide (TPR) repeat protein
VPGPIQLDDVSLPKKAKTERMPLPKIAEAVLAVVSGLPAPSSTLEKPEATSNDLSQSKEHSLVESSGSELTPAELQKPGSDQSTLVKLQRLINKGHFEDAIEIFREVALRGIAFEDRVVTATVSMLRKTKQIDAALIVLQKCRTMKVKLPEEAYTTLISLLVEFERYSLAIELLDEAISVYGISEALLHAGGRHLCEAGGLEYTERLIEKAKSSGIKPIPGTC